MRELVVATRNPHKLGEVRAILAGARVRCRGLDEFPEAPEVAEDGGSFAANAAKKAEAVARATGLPSLADDSGLEVDRLDGAPGVISARYSGTHGDSAANNARLLRELEDVPDGERSGRFVCVMALAEPGQATRLFRGESHGSILREPRGEGGFGYDPLFLSDDLGVTFAEAAPEEKNRVSHRARALAGLREAIEAGAP